ncbi:hypothetical protein [Blastococcus goldschmidtiae]|uniref:DivIVA protein n=1 Tax=Blastococcus goldschmidtiae TaxID=3075546 RepID=A0ABU2K5E8_9ACTN|nr:hypothetical protein [Blastococcus sp. DSM 46792]MDT0275423.1 hypothetical protein [Blastococcus sp. DSM 46792]
MSVELHADSGVDGDTGLLSRAGTNEHMRPDVPAGLDRVLEAAPMFRRALAGYDRFEVESYVQWAETELATAEREREHLLARQLETGAALDEARELLGHSAGGGEFLQLSRHLGSMLAAAADEAEAIRAEAYAVRQDATAFAQETGTEARRVAADAADAAVRVLAQARSAAAEKVEHARRTLAVAEETRERTRVELEGRVAEVRRLEQRAAEEAERVRERAADEAAAARLRARDEVVRMLAVGREERRRADAEATAARERLDRDAAARTAALLADVTVLEERRGALRMEVEQLAAAVPAGATRSPSRSLLGRLGWSQRSAQLRNGVPLLRR